MNNKFNSFSSFDDSSDSFGKALEGSETNINKNIHQSSKTGLVKKTKGFLKKASSKTCTAVKNTWFTGSRSLRQKYSRLSKRKQKILKISLVASGICLVGIGLYYHAPIKLLLHSTSVKTKKGLNNLLNIKNSTGKKVPVEESTSKWKTFVTNKRIIQAGIILGTLAVILLAQDSNKESGDRPVSFDILTRSTPPTTPTEKQEVIRLVTSIGRDVLHAIATSGFYGVSLVGSYSNIWCYFYCSERCTTWGLLKCLRTLMPLANLHPALARVTTYATYGPYQYPDFYDPLFNSYKFMP